MDDINLWCFQYFYHADKMNAAVHLAPVRFSPITFRLAASLVYNTNIEGLDEVLDHIGKYEEDKGR